MTRWLPFVLLLLALQPAHAGWPIRGGGVGAAPPPAPVITSPTTASGIVSTPFSYNITATNSPTSYGASGLPSPLSVDTSTGAITGTPDTAATTSATVSATNAGGTGSGPLSITITTVSPGCITGSTPPAPAAALGFNCLVFADGPFSTSRIDTTNSYGPGFNWYSATNWPNVANPSGSPFSTLVYGEDYVVNSSNDLAVELVNPAINNTGFFAVTSAGPSGSSYHGSTFTGGYFIKVIASWPQGQGGGGGTYPIFQLWPIEFFVGGQAQDIYAAENDLLEPAHNGHNWNIWHSVNGVYTDPCGPCFSGVIETLVSGTEYDFALLPASINGGTDGAKYYTNGVFYADGTGAFYNAALAQHAFLIIGASNTESMVIHRIEVWCPDTGCMQVQ